MTEALLRVEGLTKHFPVTRGVFSRSVGQVRAVDGVSFDIAPGETLGLVGESGSGKTTVGRCVLRLTDATAGRIVFDGRDVTRAPAAELPALRRQLQVVFQDPYSSLNPRLRVIDIVGEAIEVHELARGADVERRVAALLGRVGMSPSAAYRYPHEFSGGQRQRIGVARALALEPKLIVCDEAVSALDVSIQAQVVNLLVELRRELGIAYLFIAHDLSVVRHVSHRIAVMYLGRLVEVGPAKRLFEAPSHPYTRALLSAIPHPVPGPRPRRLVLSGEIPSPANPPSGCHFHTRCPAVRDRCRHDDPPVVEVEALHSVRCVHAVDLPAGSEWHAELSRRIEDAIAENLGRTPDPTIGIATQQADWGAAWNQGEQQTAEQGTQAVSVVTRTRVAGVLATAGIFLVIIGHSWLGIFVTFVAYALGGKRTTTPWRGQRLLLLAVLAAAVFAGRQVMEARKRARAHREFRALSAQIEEHAKLRGSVPATLSELSWRLYPIFPDGIPMDPWDHAWRFHAPGTDGKAFDLGSVGPDGVPSADDIGHVTLPAVKR